jgi:ribosomal protein S28E/S33
VVGETGGWGEVFCVRLHALGRSSGVCRDLERTCVGRVQQDALVVRRQELLASGKQVNVSD